MSAFTSPVSFLTKLVSEDSIPSMPVGLTDENGVRLAVANGVPLKSVAKSAGKIVLLSAGTANVTLATAPLIAASGYSGDIVAQITNTGAGTCSASIVGSVDGVLGNAQAVEYDDLSQTTLARAVAAWSVLASSTALLKIEDHLPFYGVVVSGKSGTIGLTVTLYLLP